MTRFWRSLRQDRLLLPAMLLACALMICLRMPEIIIKGRFWCEEGNIFYRNAWFLPPMQDLFNSFGGYLNLAPNAATLAARWLLPVRLAPYLTITLALLVQLCPPYLLLAARDSWARPPLVRICGVLLILFVPGVEEIWLNSLHCQFQLALCCGIILALDADRPAARGSWLRYTLLFFAPLCGPGAIALLPLFALRTLLDRSSARLWQTLVLATASLLQLALFFHHDHSRAYSLDPVALLDVFSVRHLVLPFFGLGQAAIAAAAIQAGRHAGHPPLVAAILPVLLFGAMLVLCLSRRRFRPAFWLLAAGGLVACASYFGAIGGADGLIDARAGGRYIFVPQALLSLSCLALAANAFGTARHLLWLLVAWLLAVGGFAFIHPWPFIADGPSWRHEVSLWRHDPSYEMHVWYQGWHTVSLPAPVGHRPPAAVRPPPAS